MAVLTDEEAVKLYLENGWVDPGNAPFPDPEIANDVRAMVEAPTLKVAVQMIEYWGYADEAQLTEDVRRLRRLAGVEDEVNEEVLSSRERDLLGCLTHVFRFHQASTDTERLNTIEWVRYHLKRSTQGMAEGENPQIIHDDLEAWTRAMNKPRVYDLIRATGEQLADLMAEATLLGINDAAEGNTVKSGLQVVRALRVVKYRNGHLRSFKAAYSAGRFHVEVESRS
jgi:hypothetical protein